MATVAETLLMGYTFAHRENPNIKEGEYMMRVFPGRYSSRKNAAEAYRRAVRGERSGRFLGASLLPERTTILRGKRVPMGGYMEGLWNVRVHYLAWKEGQQMQVTNSFNVQSSEHTTFASIPYIEELMLPIAEAKLEEWCQSFEDCELEYLVVVPINRNDVPAVDVEDIQVGRGYQ